MSISAAIADADPAGDISTRQTEAESVRSEIASLNSDLEVKVEIYNNANYQLSMIDGNIAENQVKLDQTTVRLGEMQSRLETRVVKIYRNGQVNMLDVLMDTSDLGDFMTKFDMLTKVGEQDRDDLDQVKQLKQQVEDTRVQLDNDKATQSTLLEQVTAEKADIEAGLGQRQQLLGSIEGEIASLQAQEAAAQQAALDAQAAAATEGESGSGGGGGGGYVGPANPSTSGGAVGIAMQYLGVPYVWGGADPSGFDCSGLVMYVYAQLGIGLPHGATAQYAAGTPIDYSELQPGDLVFFGGGGYMSHVGIYIGGGSMIHAPFEGTVVQVGSVSSGGSYAGACRL
ncbi:MAG: C40 family peptidase [Thermoleophilia bacterium]